jgi:hypothetical protein
VEGSLEASPGCRELFDSGADLAGALAGGVPGLVLAGPPGVLIGAVAGVSVSRALRRVGDELEERVMGPRQRERAGAAFALAARNFVASTTSSRRP